MSGERGSDRFEELIAAAIDSRLLSVTKALPGTVVSYDSAKKTATIQPGVDRPVEDSEGRVSFERFDPIQNVPVVFPGSAAFDLHFALEAGDAVDLIFQDFSPALWRKNGKVSTPPDARAHGPGYPFAIPWARPDGTPGTDTDESLGIPGSLTSRLHFGSSGVEVGTGPGLSAVALDTLVMTELGKIATAINGLAPGAYTPALTVGASNLKAKP